MIVFTGDVFGKNNKNELYETPVGLEPTTFCFEDRCSAIEPRDRMIIAQNEIYLYRDSVYGSFNNCYLRTHFLSHFFDSTSLLVKIITPKRLPDGKLLGKRKIMQELLLR
jgi:hypothetical protein